MKNLKINENSVKKVCFPKKAIFHQEYFLPIHSELLVTLSFYYLTSIVVAFRGPINSIINENSTGKCYQGPILLDAVVIDVALICNNVMNTTCDLGSEVKLLYIRL